MLMIYNYVRDARGDVYELDLLSGQLRLVSRAPAWPPSWLGWR